MPSSRERSPKLPFEGFYTNQDDLYSTHYVFPKIGKESSKAFYQFLESWGLGLSLLSDGVEQCLRLQALFWKNFSGVPKPGYQPSGSSSATQSYRWKNVQDLAKHVEHVTHTLEGRGSGKRYQTLGDVVFIIHGGSKKACNNPSCPDTEIRGLRLDQTPYVITLEPLLGWETVEPASDVRVASSRIFPFRRDGPRMDDPLWTQVVRKLVPQQPPTYCLECIEELMNRQEEARLADRSHNAIKGRSQGAGNYQSPCQPIRRPTSKSEMYDLREGTELEDDRSVEEPVSSTAGSLYLDGVVDQTPHRKLRHDFTHHHVDTFSWPMEYNLLFVGEIGSDGEPLPSHCPLQSFTPPSAPSSPYYTHAPLSPHSLSYNPRPPTPDKPHNRLFICRDPESTQHEEYEKLGSKALLPGSFPDFGSGNRSFGRDIDTRAVCRFFDNQRIGRGNMVKNDIRSFFTVVNPLGPSTPQRAVKTKDVNDDALSDISEKEYDSDTFGAEHTPKKKTPSPSFKPAGKALVPNAPIHRKRDLVTDNSPPPGVTKAAFEAHLQHLPSKTDLICSCRKPARTHEVQITQCMNKDCRVRWYHKDCLDRIGKLKGRHGTYVCEQCQNENFYDNQAQANRWSTKRLVQNEIGVPFTGQEMAGTFGNTGDFQASANPYGLTTSTATDKATDTASTLSPFAEPFTPNAKAVTGAVALSRLAVSSEPSLGLPTSRPHFVNEAYTRGGEHSLIADEDYEHAQVYGSYAEAWYEEDDDGGDEEGGNEEGYEEDCDDGDEEMGEVL